jgi:triosephosphate isomerase
VVAYEPIWAIGTGTAATAADAQTACRFIRRTISDIAGPQAAATVRIQYGGSVTPANAAELMGQSDVDGLLVGGASLEAASFVEIVRASRPVRATRSQAAVR